MEWEDEEMSAMSVCQDRVGILLVDDKPSNIVALEAILSSPDYHLITATSGREALRCLRQGEVAVILADVMMPLMDGFQFADAVKQDPATREIPIIFLTAMASDVEHVFRGYAAGAADYLHKPLQPEIVRAKVAVFAQLFRQRRLIEEQGRLLVESERREQLSRLVAMKQAALEEKQQVEADLQFSEERFKLLLENVRDYAIAILDPSGMITGWNIGGELMTGYAAGEILATSVSSLYLPGDLANGTLEDELRRAAESGRSADQRWLQRKDGSRFFADGVTTALRDARGGLRGFAKIVRDCTERQRAQEEREHLLAGERAARLEAEEARRRIALLDRISSTLSASIDYHELLARLSEAVVPDFADCCVVQMVGEDDDVVCAALSHVDPDRREEIRRIVEGTGEADAAIWDVQRALLSGEPELHAVMDGAAHGGEPAAGEAPPTSALRRLGARSAVVAPLVARGRTLGAATFLRFGEGHGYTQDDVQLAAMLTKRAALAVDNSRLYRESQHLNRIKDEFLATLQHELRTPLNAIVGWTELLSDDVVREEPGTLFEGLAVIRRNAASQMALIDDVLDISRIITGKLEVEARSLDLAPIVKASVDSAKLSAKAKSIQIVADLGPCSSIEGDPSRLQQILWNLISNAIKFTPQGGRIDVRLREIDGRAEIEVSDTGQGIDPLFLPHVFDRFRQEDGTTTRRQGGLGLGLAIVRHLAELHGGSVRAHSEGRGKGASFRVSIPVSNAVSTEVDGVRRLPSDSGASVQKQVQPSLQGIRVLVVDDDDDSRTIVGQILRRQGAFVMEAESASDAVRLFAFEAPDLLLTDISMPEEDGFSLIRRIRRLEKEQDRASTPIAALTAHASREDSDRIRAAGFGRHIPKPFDARGLVEAVKALVESRSGKGGHSGVFEQHH
jgi:PAS domain S-box-containing protein